MANPADFGVVKFDSNSKPLSPLEIAANLKTSRAPKTSGDDDEWFTPDDLKGQVNDPNNFRGGMTINMSHEEPKGGGAKEGNKKGGGGIFNVDEILGSIAFIILGLIMILLAFILTDTGKAITKTVATRGMA